MRPFWIVWGGQACSLLGSQLVQFALVWWLTRSTGSATVLALASLAALLPQVLVGPFAGALVDRWSRKSILIAADTGIALATLGLAILFWMNLAAVWTIYVLLMVRSTGAAFHWPAMQSSTTLMVPEKHLSRVAGLNQTLAGATGIFVPPLGALVIQVLPMQSILAIDVVTAIPAIVSLLLITIPQPARTALNTTIGQRSTVWADMRQGLRFVWNWKALSLLALIGIVVNLLGLAAGSLSPLLILQHFGGGAIQLGWWQSAGGFGAVIGGAVLGLWGGFRRRVVTQMLALALDGLVILAIALSPASAFGLVLAFIFITGILETMALGLGGAILQTIVPPEMQGRVFALLLSLSQGLAPLGLLLAGPIADALGVRFWWALTGVVICLMGLSAFLMPSVIKIEDRASYPPEQLEPPT